MGGKLSSHLSSDTLYIVGEKKGAKYPYAASCDFLTIKKGAWLT